MEKDRQPDHAKKLADLARKIADRQLGQASHWVLVALALVLAVFLLNHCDITQRQDITRGDVHTVSQQTRQLADTIQAVRNEQSGMRLADSVEKVALRMSIDEMAAALRASKDSVRFQQRVNEQMNAVYLKQTQAANALYLSKLQGIQDDGRNGMRQVLDSVKSEVSGLKAAVSDSVLTARLAKASFEEVYKTVSLNDDDFSSGLTFGKSDSGRRQAVVAPKFKNKPGAAPIDYTAPKRGVPGVLRVAVTESNRYAVTKKDTFDLPIPALKGKPKKDRPNRHKPKQKDNVSFFDHLVNFLTTGKWD